MGNVKGIASVDYFSARSGHLAELSGQVRDLADSLTGATSIDITRLVLLKTIGSDMRSLAVDYSGVDKSQNFERAKSILMQITAALSSGSPAANQPAAVQQLQQGLYALSNALASLGQEFKLNGSSAYIDWLKAEYFSTDGTITRMDLVLAEDPYSDAASPMIATIRQAVTAAVDASSLKGDAYYVGGETAIRYDILKVSDADFVRVLIIASIGILLVIILLLRSLLAPLYMVITVLFNFGATVGISTWLFLDVLKVGYLVYLMPSLVFIVLAAVGADYNIFLVSRIREESERSPVKTAVQRAVANTGGVITSCGIILAGTFATLAASSLPVMYEIGVPIAIGVLVDTFLVRALLVPSLATLTGRWSWWPSRISRKGPGGANED